MYETDRAGDYWQGQLIYWGPKVLIAILILVVTWIAARAVKWAFTKLVDRIPALREHVTGKPDETVGHQLGTIAKLIVWLVGIMAALNYLGVGQILEPVNRLTVDIFEFIPRLIGAGLIFFVGYIIARIVQRLLETTLTAVNVDGLLARIGVGETAGSVRTDTDAVASTPADTTTTTAPLTTRAGVAKAVGIVAFAFVIIPAAIAAINVLGIESITVPATNMLNQMLAAIPHILTAALWLGIAYIAARFIKTVIEGILPPTGFDNAVRSVGILPATASPSRIVANIAFIAIMLAAAIEAAKTVGGGTVAIFLAQITELGGKVIFGTLIIVAGIFLARIISNLVGSSTGEGGWGQTVVRYGIIALFSAIGLSFMGLADQIVILAFGLILGSATVAAALAFGLGGRDAAARLLERHAEGLTPPPAPRAPRAPTPPPATTAPDEGNRQPPLV
ncbi:mechanosensitive ion channel [Sphingomonas sabuli]|uniref:Small-conductance mechanosensitive channel n=1 Tax=Sphingomonas sabuli TaxID=2764186 RepID=A0A7G9KZD7_9SPHN|nr:mechanosensitive ion channel [Sphingomonas sabuli]QNM81736.1 mechanosensitive ion channel [Sphingomonas sabuli]